VCTLDLTIIKLLCGYVVIKDRYLFIDALNVIYAIDDWRRSLYRSLDSARDQLVERVASIHDAEGIHTILVFDSRSELLEVEYPFGKKTFEFVYASARLSINGVIEQLLGQISKSARSTVASNDPVVRESARSNGAIAISAEDLHDWICACDRRLMKKVECRHPINEEAWSNAIELSLVNK
jgi:predicted RNA-binding protein with PIN domain